MYYIIEHDIKNETITTTETGRGSFASALSLYHERYSKMVVTEVYDKIALMLVDSELNVIKHDIIIPNSELNERLN